MIAELNPVLRGWGQYFRTGNAADKFSEIDQYVAWRLKRLRITARDVTSSRAKLAAGVAPYFYALGLHRLLGTIAYPEAA